MADGAHAAHSVRLMRRASGRHLGGRTKSAAVGKDTLAFTERYDRMDGSLGSFACAVSLLGVYLVVRAGVVDNQQFAWIECFSLGD